MNNEAIVVGNQYKVVHSRKGIFYMLVTGIFQNGIWVRGVIKKGRTEAILPENEKFEGDEITIRASFCSFELLEKKEE